MIDREGVGKVKHSDARTLWIQPGRKNNGLNVKKESGDKNVADLGAKARPVARLEHLRELAGIIDHAEMDKRDDLRDHREC